MLVAGVRSIGGPLARLPLGELQRKIRQHLGRSAAPGPVLPTGLSGGGTMYGPVVARGDPHVMAVACDMGGLYLSRDGGQTWQLLDQRMVRTPGSPPSGDWHRWAPRTASFARDSSDVLVTAGPGRPLSAYRISGSGWSELPMAPGLARHEEVSALLVWSLPDGQPDGTDARRVYLGTTQGGYLREPGGTLRRLRYTATGDPTSLADIPGPVIAITWSNNENWDVPVVVVATPTALYRSLYDNVFQSTGGGLPPLSPTALQLVDVTACSTADDLRLYAAVAHVDLTVTTAPGAGVYVTSYTTADGWTLANGDLPDPQQIPADGLVLPRVERIATGGGSATQAFVAVRYLDTSGRYHRVYRTDDAGGVWDHVLNVGGASRNPGGSGGNVAGGGGWVDIAPFNPDFGGAIVGLAAAGSPATIVATNQADLFVSPDAGRSWSLGYTAPPGTSKALTCNGLVVTSAWEYAVHPRPPDHQDLHFVCYTDIGLARSTDGGATWDSLRLPTGDANDSYYNTVYQVAAATDAGGLMWAATAQQHDLPYVPVRAPGGDVLGSSDYGASWHRFAGAGLPGLPVTSVVVAPLAPGADPELGQRLWCAVYGDGVWRSTDSGRTWQRCPSQPSTVQGQSNRCVYRLRLHENGTLFVGVAGADTKDGAIASSPDDGTSRSDIPLTLAHPSGDTPSRRVTDFGVHPADSNCLFVCTIGYWDTARRPGGVWKSVNRGANWTNVAGLNNPGRDGGQLPAHDPDYVSGYSVSFDPSGTDRVVATTVAHGAWISASAGRPDAAVTSADWQPTGGPFLNHTRALLAPQATYFCSFGAGVWRQPSSVQTSLPTDLVKLLARLRPRPNPRPGPGPDPGPSGSDSHERDSRTMRRPDAVVVARPDRAASGAVDGHEHPIS